MTRVIRIPLPLYLLCLWAVFSHVGFAGPLQRAGNSTLKMPSTPPSVGYGTTNAFPNLVFKNPVCIATPPGETNRLFIVERAGVVVVITNLAAPTRTVFLDISSEVTSTTLVTGEEGLLGLAFHPGYATNGYFYLFFTGPAVTPDGGGRHDILARFQASPTNANQASAATEVRFIMQVDQASNHNGGDLHFGADGYLYVSLGDEGGEYGEYGNAQRIDRDFFCSIMRLDVDKRPGNLVPNPHPGLASLTNYWIPADNPYVGATNFNGAAVNPANVRTEFWAVGMRNPWRFSFDPLTQLLYLGHVGQVSLEWINIVTNKANCGWNFYEGSLQLTNPLPAGFTLTPPLYQYGHTNGRVAIVGGVVYRGFRIPQLYGTYLYADFGSGEVFGLRHSGANVTQNNVLFIDANARYSSFGLDPSNGDVLYAAARSGSDGTINRIIYSGTTNGTPLPPTLADTGAFTNLMSLTSALDPLAPATGIVPYDINVPFWSDNAEKSRWFSVPNPNLTIGVATNGNWLFPTGTVWVKHFNLQLTNGVAASTRRVETRLLVKNAAGVYGAVYRWGDLTTNATLVSENGFDEPFIIADGGTVRTQVWHYPSRNECTLCHTPEGGYALGFRNEQLNRDHTYGLTATNQLAALADAGYFAGPLSNIVSALAPATDNSATLEYRVRSYLAANCVQCHQPGGQAQQANWDARISTPTALAGIINGPLVQSLGNPANRVVAPGSPSNSVLLTRISTRDLGHVGSIQMPPLASNLLDTQAIALVTQWILSITNTIWLTAAPDKSTVIMQGPTNLISLTVVPTPDVSGPIALAVSGTPSGLSAIITPSSVTGSNQASLQLAANSLATPGNYALTVNAIAGGRTNSTAIALTIANPLFTPGALMWSAGGGANTSWNSSLNWTNVTAHTNGLPGPANDVIFSRAGAGASLAVISNVVNTTTTIKSLWYANGTAPATNHTTLISPGATLNVIGTTNISGGTGFKSDAFTLLVGINASTTPTMTAKITGGGGALNLNNSTGVVHVSQFNTINKHNGANLRAVLDMSGLDTFTANVSRLLIGCMSNGSAGIVYLAKTNHLVLSGAVAPQLDLGDNDSNQGNPSLLYLGVTNAIFADGVASGRGKGTNGSIYFNPAFVPQNPVAYFRGQNGMGRVASWTISDLLSSSGTADVTKPSGTNDFTGGRVDALVDTLVLARTTATAPSQYTTSNRVSTGTLTFSAGTFDVNNLTNGLQLGNARNGAASWDTAAGQINVNGGTLRVNNNLVLAVGMTSLSPAFSRGIVAVRNGTLFASRLIAGAGSALITLTNSTFDLVNGMATSPRLATLALTNSTLRLRLNAASPGAQLAATNLAAAGLNTIVIESVANVVGSTNFPILAYGTLAGSLANFAPPILPPNYTGQLTNNVAAKTISLLLTRLPGAGPQIASTKISGANLIINGTNGTPNSAFSLLTSTNIGLPLSNWSVVGTGSFDATGNFQFTNALDGSMPRRFYRLRVP